MVDFANTAGITPPSPPATGPVRGTTTLEAGTALDGSPPTEPPPPDEERRREPGALEIAGGVVLLTAWSLVFGIGIVFPSEPIRDALRGEGATLSSWTMLRHLGWYLLTYTVSNVAVLCCISAWLGELGRRTRIDGLAGGLVYRRGDYIAAVMRGFLAYLAVLTGYVVIGSGVNVFVTPSAEQFIRLAAIVSLAGFLIGFNPALFRRFEGSITDRIITERKADGSVTRRVESTTGVRETVRTEPSAPTAGTAGPVEGESDPVGAAGGWSSPAPRPMRGAREAP